ncbi:ABC transporter permease [Nocardioides mesophilus]|uniref:ABC transporter permease n=1 Tax=Nocardioides mesophilus TaxID=433659 RepID=A0A7G9RDN3_9ACTN|nr:ABC transporter permease [Nocardioides mesophilus]QNN53708.1 ABC transporter permease [Nocardioides mesophilus]
MSETPERGGRTSTVASWLPSIKVTAAAIFLALLVGAVLIAFSDRQAVESLRYFFSYPWDFFRYAGEAIIQSYWALLTGAVGSWKAITQTLERAAPLICAGLGVSLAFRAGLFNIGAQGQLILGAICAGYVGFAFDLPPGLHLLVALLAGVLGGAVWGGISGYLKAQTGAHEVITTIMLNYVASSVLLYLLTKNAFQRPGSDNPRSLPADDSAMFPTIFGVHTGVVVAVLVAVGVWWLLERSTLGFEMRAVGANADAARTAGMSLAKVYTLAMLVAGGLAGLAATQQILGHHDSLTANVAGSIGFDAITVALLGRATPLGTVLAGLLFGALSAGGVQMQASAAATPLALTQVLQALIVLFVAAPALVRGVMRFKDTGGGATVMAKGWGS